MGRPLTCSHASYHAHMDTRAVTLTHSHTGCHAHVHARAVHSHVHMQAVTLTRSHTGRPLTRSHTGCYAHTDTCSCPLTRTLHRHKLWPTCTHAHPQRMGGSQCPGWASGGGIAQAGGRSRDLLLLRGQWVRFCAPCDGQLSRCFPAGSCLPVTESERLGKFH